PSAGLRSERREGPPRRSTPASSRSGPHRAFFDGCGTSGQLRFEDGREIHIEDRFDWTPEWTAEGDPRVAQISVLRMEGPPVVVVDNRDRLRSSSGGCRTLGRGWGGALQLAFLFAFVLLGRWPLRRAAASN
ncbi:MAG: hypothetical protein AAFZ18_36265, partial [Myxococcota bacterium]